MVNVTSDLRGQKSTIGTKGRSLGGDLIPPERPFGSRPEVPESWAERLLTTGSHDGHSGGFRPALSEPPLLTGLG